jgi:hypothetical protein
MLFVRSMGKNHPNQLLHVFSFLLLPVLRLLSELAVYMPGDPVSTLFGRSVANTLHAPHEER